ncbi:hypothetical protein Pelo_17753 [Pelomyxa schiedti]|nr:hypothetical protein Pelo_17753 [Pelomyxa schiedti]
MAQQDTRRCTSKFRNFEPEQHQHQPYYETAPAYELTWNMASNIMNICLDTPDHVCQWMCTHTQCCPLSYTWPVRPPPPPLVIPAPPPEPLRVPRGHVHWPPPYAVHACADAPAAPSSAAPSSAAPSPSPSSAAHPPAAPSSAAHPANAVPPVIDNIAALLKARGETLGVDDLEKWVPHVVGPRDKGIFIRSAHEHSIPFSGKQPEGGPPSFPASWTDLSTRDPWMVDCTLTTCRADDGKPHLSFEFQNRFPKRSVTVKILTCQFTPEEVNVPANSTVRKTFVGPHPATAKFVWVECQIKNNE